MEFTEQKLLERYEILCKKRDSVYKKNEPLEKELEVWNKKAEEARVKAAEIADQIDKNFGSDWFVIKKEIATLARALGRAGGPLSLKE